ncbi:XRE family transcriptional regulator [Flavobacterium silvisoli]|uniref:XRE family transcriptional regulator n=1 Tax=Flavobacterium silvisoli TaxID=2529433 RepID=A0A4Q9Z3P3_9FLAO|nr:helix-turn-helix transcriptional regulator [Flavobacterium silvisoli]TBX71054.1 XRE family transcriptional regulator [Flavobacterium silvisoli]
MKTHQTICELLGLKQQEMAMLLGVHRTQWSMFELGKRSLPKEALMKLHEILTLNQSLDKMDADETSINKPIGNFTKEELESLLKENEYQCLATERKLNYQHQKLQSLLKAERIREPITERFSSKQLSNQQCAADD